MNFLLRIKKLYNSFFYYVAFGQSPFLLGPPLLGLATDRKRLGQAPPSRQSHGVFHQPGFAHARANRRGHLLPGILRRHFPGHRLTLAPHFPGAHHQPDRCLHHRRPRSPLSIFSDPDKFYAAAPYTFLVASLIILFFGPGKFAVDALLNRWFPALPGEKKPPLAW